MNALSRRDLLRVGLTGAGALLVETFVPGCAAPDARFAPASQEFVPNAWIRIAPDSTVTMVLDRVEMGQGTMTSHPTLVAEELELDPADIRVVFAPAARAYDNPDGSLGFQITGGSSSTRTSYQPLREAAATTREMLRRAAAHKWSTAVDYCKVEKGVITHTPTGRRFRYGDLVREAAREEPIVPPLKAQSEFRYIGKSVPRKDLRAKVDGSCIYGIDVDVAGALVAVLLRPPRLGASVASFDAHEVDGKEGVRVFAIEGAVAVVAKSYWRAREASTRVNVKWEGGATTSTSELRKQYRARLDHAGVPVMHRGTIKPADEAHTLEAYYEVPYLAHATMEPQNAVARERDGKWDVWAPTQAPSLAVEMVKRLTGKSYEDITIHQTFLGGGFGRRLSQDYVAEAVRVSQGLGGHAVKVVWSREDDMQHSLYRPMTMNVLRATWNDQGVTSWFHRAVSQSIISQTVAEWGHALAPNGAPDAFKSLLGRTARSLIASSTMPDFTSTEGAHDFAYDIPNVRVEYARVEPGPPVGSWRSVGSSENVYIVESFLDEVAARMKVDPFTLRQKMLGRAPQNKRVLELAAEKAGWTTPLPPGRHRGIAQCKAFESYCAQVAEVSVEGEKVHVHRVVCAIDRGLVVNPDIVRAQIEGGIAFGLGAALHQEITWTNGAVDQTNFHQFAPLRLHEMPEIEVHLVESNAPPTGVGEPGVPPVAPAVVNAILAATGRGIRTLPIRRGIRPDPWPEKEAPQ